MRKSNQEAYDRWMTHQEEVAKWVANNEKANAARRQAEQVAQYAHAQAIQPQPQPQPVPIPQPQFQLDNPFNNPGPETKERIGKLLDLSKTTAALTTSIEESYYLARLYQETLAHDKLNAADVYELTAFFCTMARIITKAHHIIQRYGHLADFQAQHIKGFPVADEEEKIFTAEWKHVVAGYDLVKSVEGILVDVMDRGYIRSQASANAWARYGLELQRFGARLGMFCAEILDWYR
ncbi:hypothetical protein MFIFM68171_07279 [Madurella fahalii]|uniref:Uncharacterized protein n=1 Tax=Madurella fahalii TaxID=1157608 RepID=A0ABQ0GHB8_9PEZI